jgi:molybdate transport system regulatory protein
MDAYRQKKWKARSKVWLELDGKPFMGEGRLSVLQAIDRNGSILAASKETKISYRRIRGAIRDMENAIGHPIVITCRGGKEGGGAMITDLARDLISRFERQQEGIRETVDELCQHIFR